METGSENEKELRSSRSVQTYLRERNFEKENRWRFQLETRKEKGKVLPLNLLSDEIWKVKCKKRCALTTHFGVTITNFRKDKTKYSTSVVVPGPKCSILVKEWLTLASYNPTLETKPIIRYSFSLVDRQNWEKKALEERGRLKFWEKSFSNSRLRKD